MIGTRTNGVQRAEPSIWRHAPGRALVAVIGTIALAGAVLTASAGAKGTAAKPTLNIVDGTQTCFGGHLGYSSYINVETLLAYEPFIRVLPGPKYVPGLASTWRVHPGNKAITFTLRKNARFSDGARVTARAVKTWADWRMARSEVASLSQAGKPRSVEILGTWRVRFRMDSPMPLMAWFFASKSDWAYPVSPLVVREFQQNPKSDYLNRHSGGAGPYALDASQTITENQCTLVPNKYYYDKSKLKWSKIVTRLVIDPNATLAALRNGQADVVTKPDSNIVKQAASLGFRVVYQVGFVRALQFTSLDGRLSAALADVRVRRAMAYGMRRNTYLGLFGPGTYTTSVFYGVSHSPFARKFVNQYSYEPARARSLLAAAGYANGFSAKVICAGPWAGAFNMADFCRAVAKDLSEIGIRLEVHDQLQEAVDDFANHTSPLAGFPMGDQYPHMQYSGWFKPGDVWNPFRYVDRVSNRLYLKSLRVSSKKAEHWWTQMTERVVSQVLVLPALYSPFYTLVSNRVGGVRAASVILAGSDDPINWYPTGK